MTTVTPAPPKDATSSRAWNIVLWVLRVVAALWLIMAALGKFSGAEATVETFEAIGFGAWFRYVVAGLELAGVIGLFIPRLVGLAALALVALLVGATLVQLLVVGSGVLMPLPLLVICVVIAWRRRRSTSTLVAAISGHVDR